MAARQTLYLSFRSSGTNLKLHIMQNLLDRLTPETKHAMAEHGRLYPSTVAMLRSNLQAVETMQSIQLRDVETLLTLMDSSNLQDVYSFFTPLR